MDPIDQSLCQHLLRRGSVALEDLMDCAREQRAARKRGVPAPPLLDLLRSRRLICAADLEGWSRPRRRRTRTTAHWRQVGFGRRRDGLDVGDRLGDFRVEARLARGSTGAVFAAICRRTGRAVALKVLAGDRAEVDGPARFAHESRLACSLRHPNLVAGLSAGSQGGRSYYAMERIEAPSLREHLKHRGPLDPLSVLTVGAAILEALRYLHEEGIVHRDVSPANILLDPTGAKLCDLGLARELDPEAPQPPSPAPGQPLGTPHYMAPEQARDHRSAGPAADLYALGATLFHAATGRPPFREESGIVVVSRHLFDDVPDARDVRGELPQQLAALIRTLTRKHPGQRPADAAQALRSFARVHAELLPHTATRAA